MKYRFSVFLVSLLTFSSSQAESPQREKVIFSPPLMIDKIYRSMMGPTKFSDLAVDERNGSIHWITGVKVDIVDDISGQSTSPEFMCHANIDIGNLDRYRHTFQADARSHRFVTLSQGQESLVFPQGMGYPVFGKTDLELNSQVLNLNQKDIRQKVKQKITIEYVKDNERRGEMKALFPLGASVMVAVDKKHRYFGIKNAESEVHGPACSIAQPVIPGQNAHKDRFGADFSGHWLVPPGRHVYQSNVTEYLALPYDTTVHYIAVHLHPFAEYIELIDLTAGKSIFKSRAVNYKGKIGLKSVESFSSKQGVMLYKNHQYSLKTVYHNISQEPQDAMAVMYIFVLNKKFKRTYL